MVFLLLARQSRCEHRFALASVVVSPPIFPVSPAFLFHIPREWGIFAFKKSEK